MLKKLFLNERLTVLVVVINAVAIFCAESNIAVPFFDAVDFLCMLYFILEMLAKFRVEGLRAYFHSGSNLFDFIWVVLSVPSILIYFRLIEVPYVSSLLIIRVLRVLRFFRIVRLSKGVEKLYQGFKLAMRECSTILLGFIVLTVVLGLIDCAFLKDVAPDFFGTPTLSIYSVFRLFTIEGWYEIPDAIGACLSPECARIATFWLVLQVIAGGIIGMSFINSIFVDAMVSDNNDEVLARIDKLQRQIEELSNSLRNKNS